MKYRRKLSVFDLLKFEGVSKDVGVWPALLRKSNAGFTTTIGLELMLWFGCTKTQKQHIIINKKEDQDDWNNSIKPR